MGGAEVTIYGDGFDKKTSIVYFGNDISINPQSLKISYDSIVLNTLPIYEADYFVYVNVNNQNAGCNMNTNCTFTISSNYTPLINSISPNTVNDSNTQIVISGINFGNQTDKVTVKIGNQNCLVNIIDDSSITCTLDGLDLGIQLVVVTTGN